MPQQIRDLSPATAAATTRASQRSVLH